MADCQRNADNWTVLQLWAETLALLLLTIHNQLNQRFLKAATVHPTLPADRCFIEVERKKNATRRHLWPFMANIARIIEDGDLFGQ